MATVDRKRRCCRRELSALVRTREVISRPLSPASPASSTRLVMMQESQCPSSPINVLAFSGKITTDQSTDTLGTLQITPPVVRVPGINENDVKVFEVADVARGEGCFARGG